MRKSVKTWFPIKNIENGVLELKSGRFCKVLEVSPINFALKTKSEQENILYQYKMFFNVCNFDIQILVQSKKGNLENHILKIRNNIKVEEDEDVKILMEEYIRMVEEDSLKTAISKKFYIIFSSEFFENLKDLRERAIKDLNEKTLKIKETLNKCGNDVKEFDEENDELIGLIYSYLNPVTSKIQKLKGVRYEYKNI